MAHKLTLDELQDTIHNVVDEIRVSFDEDEFIDPNTIYSELAWFYHAGIEAGQHTDIHDEVIDTMYDVSEDWSHKVLDELGDVLENYFLTGYHGARSLGGY